MIQPGLHIVRKKGDVDNRCDVLWYWQEGGGWYYVLGAGMKTQLTEDNKGWLDEYEILETVIEGRKHMKFTGTEIMIKTRFKGKSRNSKGEQTEYQMEYKMRNVHLFNNLLSRLPGISHDFGMNDKQGKKRP